MTSLKSVCTIREYPPQDQPHARMHRHGANTLTDTELLAMVIRRGTTGCNAIDVARDLLQRFGGLHSLGGRQIAELCKVPGIGPVKAGQIMVMVEMSKRLDPIDRISFLSSADVAKHYMPQFHHTQQEVFTVLILDARNRLIREHRASEGSLTASIVHPREVFKLAIIESAASVIFLHNHPSGDPTPSQDDIKITKQLVDAGKIIDIRVLDHIILGYHKFTSLSGKGLI